MARLKTNILDGGSGRLGNIILYDWKGISCMRTFPSRYRDKKSEAQLKQRQKLKLVHAFLRSFMHHFDLTFHEKGVARTPYQSAQSYNMKYAISGKYPDQYIDLNKALIAKGDLPLPENIDLTIKDNLLTIEWDVVDAEDSGLNSDQLLVFYKEKKDYVHAKMLKRTVTREKGIFNWDTSSLNDITECDIWIAFINKDKTEVSNSVCLTAS